MKDELHQITRTLAEVARSVCRYPEDFQVFERRPTEDSLRIKLSPHMADIRLLIGSDGRQSKAFNHLAEVMARRFGLKGECILAESYIGEREDNEPVFNPEFTADALYDAMVPVVNLALGRAKITIEDKPEYEPPGYAVFIDVPEEETATVAAINDVFFLVGKRNGRKVKVKTLNSKFESEQRKRAGVA